MKKRSITISFECDASNEIIEEIANHMKYQLESLNDGTLVMNQEDWLDGECVDEEYKNVKVKIK